ncbi:hypothetical protein TGAM01_v211024 [Trichoderma gamsii]|uniref:Uncharacterized protein n=1 Tax=Trichoderma gamsii TaxID=398673 RepID=A0A2P4Z733_9HYPO|nr:hypothetical protein TGAM01_v211024 [Trichoderma gamsii]PON20101.1 hypothetical protein TGAM01_v211024 [Trichoderma gamsii]
MMSPITTADERIKKAIKPCIELMIIRGNESPSDNDAVSIERSVVEEKDEINVHASGDQGLEDSGCLNGNSSCLNILHSRITIQDGAEALGEANTADVTANQAEQEAKRRNTSPNQPSPPNLHPNDGRTLSIKEEYLQTLQDGRTTMPLELEELKAKEETAEEKAQKEKMSAKPNQLLHLFQSPTSAEFILFCSNLPKVLQPQSSASKKAIALASEIVIQNGKRKMEEQRLIDTNRKKAKLLAQFNAKSNQYLVELTKNVQRHEAASEQTPQ